MAEYIEKQAAIKAVCDACGVIPDGEKDTCPYKYKGAGCREYDKIIDIPPADVRPVVRGKETGVMIPSPGDETICGYPIRDLIIFADACRVAGVGPKELKDFVENVEVAYGVVAKAMYEHFARCSEEYLRPTATYENEEVEGDVLIEALEKNTEKIGKKANECYTEYRKHLQGKIKNGGGGSR